VADRGGRDRHRFRMVARRGRHLPVGQANLDAELDAVQRGLVLLLLAAFYAVVDLARWRKPAFRSS